MRVLLLATDQVPSVASDVHEHSDITVGLSSRRTHELNTRGHHPRICGVEIIHVQGEANPASGLPPDYGDLLVAVCLRKKQASHRTRRPHYHPPLRAPVIRQGWAVLNELEAERVYEEADRRVVFADYDGDQAQMHVASINVEP